MFVSQVFRMVARAAAPSERAMSGCVFSFSSCCANSKESSGEKRRPFSPSRMISVKPPHRDATTAHPQAIASQQPYERFSHKEGKIATDD
jgi:hypothetical protein